MATARARGDAIVAAAALVIAGGYYLLAREIPESLLGDRVGATGLPNIYAALLALVGLLLMVQAWRAPREAGLSSSDEIAPGAPGALKHLRATGLLVPGVAYLMLINVLGYAVAVCLLILAVALYAGARPGFRLVIISIVGAIALWITFVLLFNVPLPSGTAWHAVAGLLSR